MDTSPMLSPIVQYGFAGFCAVLLAMGFWMFNKVIVVLQDTNKVIEQNTGAIRDLHNRSTEQTALIRQLHEEVLKVIGSLT